MGQYYGAKYRGCQKKMLMIKNTGSEFFDEAYFIIKESKIDTAIGDDDMTSEANRIISENMIISRDPQRGRNKKEQGFSFTDKLRLYLAGAISVCGIYAAFYFISII